MYDPEAYTSAEEKVVFTCAALVIALMFAPIVAAQAPTAGSAKPVPTSGPPPDHVLFRFFFMHVTRVEMIADQLRSQGKDDRAPRQQFKNSAGLTERETSLLKEVAQT